MLKDYPAKQHKKLKSRARKGIPDCFRGYAWCMLTDSQRDNSQMNPRTESIIDTSISRASGKREVTKYMSNLMNQEGDKRVLIDIHKDVSRTMPAHIHFQQQFDAGQNDLFAVLKCLSIAEPEIGYVQGMGYMVAILLMYVDKADAFTIMLNIINSEPY